MMIREQATHCMQTALKQKEKAISVSRDTCRLQYVSFTHHFITKNSHSYLFA